MSPSAGRFQATSLVLADGTRSTTLLGPNGIVEAAERYLAYLTHLEASPNTVRSYAYGLQHWFSYCAFKGFDWRHVTLDHIAEFVAWLRFPERYVSDLRVLPLNAGTPRRKETTVNLYLSAVYGLYEFHGDTPLAAHLDRYRQKREVAKSHRRARQGTRPIHLPQPEPLPKAVTETELRSIFAATETLRDKLLLAFWGVAGFRIGATLGLRHEDINEARSEVRIMPRDHNANGARAKTPTAHVLPVERPLIRLYVDYLHEEYGDLDSDYVFVALRGRKVGTPLTHDAVYSMVRRLRVKSGVHFRPHMLRHFFATDLRRRGARLELISALLCHASVETTHQTYVHLDVEDLRRELEAVRSRNLPL